MKGGFRKAVGVLEGQVDWNKINSEVTQKDYDALFAKCQRLEAELGEAIQLATWRGLTLAFIRDAIFGDNSARMSDEQLRSAVADMARKYNALKAMYLKEE